MAKPVPLMVMVSPGPPAGVLGGEMLVIENGVAVVLKLASANISLFTAIVCGLAEPERSPLQLVKT
jgi:hypothetical protein